MSNFIMFDKDELQDFFNTVAGNTLYLAENLQTFRNRNFTDITEILAFVAATTEIAGELLETVTAFGNAHGLVDNEENKGDENNNDDGLH